MVSRIGRRLTARKERATIRAAGAHSAGCEAMENDMRAFPIAIVLAAMAGTP